MDFKEYRVWRKMCTYSMQQWYAVGTCLVLLMFILHACTLGLINSGHHLPPMKIERVCSYTPVPFLALRELAGCICYLEENIQSDIDHFIGSSYFSPFNTHNHHKNWYSCHHFPNKDTEGHSRHSFIEYILKLTCRSKYNTDMWLWKLTQGAFLRWP